jgi:hypothetical protein
MSAVKVELAVMCTNQPECMTRHLASTNAGLVLLCPTHMVGQHSKLTHLVSSSCVHSLAPGVNIT